MATTTEITYAYRNLYRNLLKAVQYSVPTRFVARNQLRRAFREPGATYDGKGIKRTIWFLEAAAREKGMEHRILKNLLRVQQVRYRKKDYSAHDPLKHAE
ncbi:complex 1 protein [Fusarium austroafricanum]|uniref:Complex 1 protein n=1 Tax=Fusarium austroafricanum TaxID=2364996 RepID=A0A8H4KLG2_9HYPO|nr:complex 1 protein [Fusarium austroafricanum]